MLSRCCCLFDGSFFNGSTRIRRPLSYEKMDASRTSTQDLEHLSLHTANNEGLIFEQATATWEKVKVAKLNNTSLISTPQWNHRCLLPTSMFEFVAVIFYNFIWDEFADCVELSGVLSDNEEEKAVIFCSLHFGQDPVSSPNHSW